MQALASHATDPATHGADEALLWQQLRQGGDAGSRERLLKLHMGYARIVAGAYYARRFHDEIEYADYLQYASVGLLEAMERFDPGRGVQFRTFAARRMHGAILNGLERFTEKQQQIAARQRLRAERMADVKAMAGERSGAGTAPPQEPEQLLAFVSEAGIGLALCWLLEGSGMVDDGAATVSQPFYRSAELRQLRERLVLAIEGLPAQERAVIRSHYLQEVAFEDIAATMQLTRGRISQVHRRGLARLRGVLAEQGDWSALF
ncbi:sigma-70 family RNA polymerase sigma factor [Ramlibacter alkalitolerans]|uniref:Sigma-70 family RNA polymerase sigma factor n=1 Tax=Ramlibacter alkalitolerans TaxID=2039631 RepID=A0ABS1JU49_9BURK|nr:sigma-70 family RNA polymerase sigma factor [Ramlibacter alkalitolerans]MBL0427381.1 sigma-70 family RNA polymerase sigma factor [Ramlibacter alkalitolerans]